MTGSLIPPRHILIVIGMHRSGTSLCAQMLSVLGMDMADDILPNAGNMQGHWERVEIVAFHDRVLALFNRDWFGPSHAYALPQGWWADPRVRAIRNEMVDWLRLRIGTSQHFGFKDPRTTCLLPLWREICAELSVQPRFVLCVRHPALVACSLAARGDVVDPRESEHRWVVYNARAIVDLGLHPVCILPYEDWFDDEARNVRRLAEFLNEEDGLEDAMLRRIAAGIVAPELRHHVLHRNPLNDAIPARMYRLLVTSANQAELSLELRELAVEYWRFEQITRKVQDIASMTGPLQARLAECETEIAAAAAREAELHTSMMVQTERTDAATAAVEASQTEIVAAAAREAELHASVIAQTQRADAATAAVEALQTEIAARAAAQIAEINERSQEIERLNAQIIWKIEGQNSLSDKVKSLETEKIKLTDQIKHLQNELQMTAVFPVKDKDLSLLDQAVNLIRKEEKARWETTSALLLAARIEIKQVESELEAANCRIDGFRRDDIERHNHDVFITRFLNWNRSAPKPISFSAQRLIAKARRFARKQRWSAAERTYRDVLATNPRLFKIWVQYGHTLKQQAALQAALGAYSRAAKLDPSNVDVLLHLGHIQKELDQPEAISTFQRAIRLLPSRVDTWDVLRDLGQDPLAYLTHLVNSDQISNSRASANPTFRFKRIRHKALVAERQGKWQTAVELYTKAIAIDPNNARTWLLYGHALTEVKRIPEAQAAYFQAFALDPVDNEPLGFINFE